MCDITLDIILCSRLWIKKYVKKPLFYLRIWPDKGGIFLSSETLIQLWIIVGPPFTTLAQH